MTEASLQFRLNPIFDVLGFERVLVRSGEVGMSFNTFICFELTKGKTTRALESKANYPSLWAKLPALQIAVEHRVTTRLMTKVQNRCGIYVVQCSYKFTKGDNLSVKQVMEGAAQFVRKVQTSYRDTTATHTSKHYTMHIEVAVLKPGCGRVA
jgi:hypothetical protein